MTTNINETNQVEEQPATYNRNFQFLLIGGLVFVVVVMVYASLFRSGPADSRIEEQVQREIRKQALSNPEQEFPRPDQKPGTTSAETKRAGPVRTKGLYRRKDRRSIAEQ